MRRSYSLDVFGRPWAILPPALRRMAAQPLIGEAEDRRPVASSARDRIGAARAGSVEVIPIAGVITQRYSFMTWLMGGTAVEDVRAALREAVGDSEVRAVVLDIDSPGGVVDGLTELAADMREMAAAKPIVAVANPTAASAAYWIASQAAEVVVTPSGSVGSVGVYALHMDWSRALDAEGVTPTFISAGPFKVEGNAFEPLSDEARDAIQSEVDHFYSMFVGDVAKGRNVSRSVVTDAYGGGRMVMPPAALSAGMVDRVESLEAVVRRLERGRTPAAGARAEDASVRPFTDSTVEHIAPAAEAEPSPKPQPKPDPVRVTALSRKFHREVARRKESHA